MQGLALERACWRGQAGCWRAAPGVRSPNGHSVAGPGWFWRWPPWRVFY